MEQEESGSAVSRPDQDPRLASPLPVDPLSGVYMGKEEKHRGKREQKTVDKTKITKAKEVLQDDAIGELIVTKNGQEWF